MSSPEYGQLARTLLPAAVWDYIDSGAGEELTVQANLEAFRRTWLRPRTLVDVEHRDLSTTVLGCRLAAPIGVAPMAYHRLAHPDAEVATARAASAEALLLVVSAFASQRLEEIAEAASAPLWFQVYWFRDRSITAELLRRAAAAGYRAAVLTVDAPLMGRRDRDLRNSFSLPPHVSAANLVATPASAGRPGAAEGSDLAQRTAELIDPTLTWRDIEWLRSVTHLPIVLKGITTGEDAAKAVAAGVDGLVVSNHGGRQVDGAIASLDALPEVAGVAGGHCEILLDGGIRRGGDVLKALALGARAVLVGRPVLWGLAVHGEAGARSVLRLIRDELESSMALCGCPAIGDIGADLARAWSSRAAPPPGR